MLQFSLTAVVTCAIVLRGCVVVAIAARLSQVSWLIHRSLRSAAAGRGGLLTPNTLPSQGIRLCTGQQKRTSGERDSSPGGAAVGSASFSAPQPSLSDVGDTQHGYAGHSPRVGSSPNSWKPEGSPLRSTTSIPKNTFLHRNMICVTRRRPCPSHCPELVKQAPPDKAECPGRGRGETSKRTSDAGGPWEDTSHLGSQQRPQHKAQPRAHLMPSSVVSDLSSAVGSLRQWAGSVSTPPTPTLLAP